MQREDFLSNTCKLDAYVLIKKIGMGGMGEVFLAFDPICKRHLAIKKIRNELLGKPHIHERFLREARIASQLTHPSIIPIFSIHSDPHMSYYTMPYVEGKTLKELLQKCKQKTIERDSLSQEESLSSLLHIFLKVTEAIGYSHSKAILHRDLKPDNVIVGKFGEVFLLDWGIAQLIEEKEENTCHDSPIAKAFFTRPGKIAGTLTYMAPERALGEPSSFQTDIYALGVMLYQILTLTSPFRRSSIKELRKKAHLEQLVEPKVRAPDRDIPQQLAEIATKCLAFSKKDRYQKVEELLSDLKKYIEGQSSWIFITDLSIKKEVDWQLHENILLAKHIALTRNTEIAEWASLMVSSASFAPYIKIKIEIEVEKKCEGIGILLGIPEKKERESIQEGYCLWCGREGSFLLRSQVLVKEIPLLFLSDKKKHSISLECILNQIRIFFDDVLISSYASLLPFTGTHVGLLYKDTEFILHSFQVFAASQPLTVHCLAIPDAFFVKGHFDIALAEYRRIALCFSGRSEAREAHFRAALSLLEQAKEQKSKRKRSTFFQQALEELEHLHSTPQAPLKYLGQSMIYAAMGESEEEARCLEFALRKFTKHALLPFLQERVIFRSHESSLFERKNAYRLILIGLRYIPHFMESQETKKLLQSLQKHWENLPQFAPLYEQDLVQKDALILRLAFWLAKKETLQEYIDKFISSQENPSSVEEGLMHLVELGFPFEISSLIPTLFSLFPQYDWSYLVKLVEFHKHPEKQPLSSFFSQEMLKEKRGHRLLLHLVEHALALQMGDQVSSLLSSSSFFGNAEKIVMDSYHIWSLLLQKKLTRAGKIFASYSEDILNEENSPLHFLYGIWLTCKNGMQSGYAHFSKVWDTPFPLSPSLLSHFLTKKISLKKWEREAFFWEKRALWRQLALFYHCTGERKKALHYKNLSLQPPKNNL